MSEKYRDNSENIPDGISSDGRADARERRGDIEIPENPDIMWARAHGTIVGERKGFGSFRTVPVFQLNVVWEGEWKMTERYPAGFILKVPDYYPDALHADKDAA